jgi:hypothetical protein
MTRALIPSAAGPDAGPRQLLVTLGSAIPALQVVRARELVGNGSLNPRYWDRMRGWSNDPDRPAFLRAVLELLSLHLAAVAAGPARAWGR